MGFIFIRWGIILEPDSTIVELTIFKSTMNAPFCAESYIPPPPPVPWPMATKETRINGLPQNTIWKAFPRHNSSLIGCKNQAKFENDCISRNGHRIKITQPNSTILVSFSSAEDALSNDVKQCNTFSSQLDTENQPFHCFGEHPV